MGEFIREKNETFYRRQGSTARCPLKTLASNDLVLFRLMDSSNIPKLISGALGMKMGDLPKDVRRTVRAIAELHVDIQKPEYLTFHDEFIILQSRLLDDPEEMRRVQSKYVATRSNMLLRLST